MEIKITHPQNNNGEFTPAIGEKTNDLIERFKDILDQDEISNLIDETFHILSNCTNPQSLKEQEITHLTIGYVQSGKTMSFTTLTALAADNGFRIIVFLAGTKTNLLSQTTKRLSKDLITKSTKGNNYRIYENPTLSNSEEIRNKLRITSKPTILISVLKHYVHIHELSKIFDDRKIKTELGKQGVLIIDDEADQASLNGFSYANSKKASKSPEWDEETENKESSTYSSILKLRSVIPNHSYVQYTATPQGPLLISLLDLLSPKSHTLLTPGKKYTGGKTFFKDYPDLIISIPEEEVYHYKKNPLISIPNSLKEALQIYILSVAIVTYYWEKENFLSMMIHPGQQKDINRLFHNWVKELIEKWTTILNLEDIDIAKGNLLQEFELMYNQEAIKLYYKEDNLPSFNDIKEFISDVINDTQIYLIISDKDAEKEVDWESSTSHILVGADMLNRGFTVENLAITYMPRYSIGKSNADTIQQRCRFFGYKLNYLNSCRVYLPTNSIAEYFDYITHEEEMRSWLKENENLEGVQRQLIISENLNATRKNILPINVIKYKMKNWHAMNALHGIENNKIVTEEFINNNQFSLWVKQYNTIDRNHKFALVGVESAIEFLSKFKFGNFEDSARKSATIRYLQYLSGNTDNPINNVCFIQMAHESEYRERKFDSGKNKIEQIFSGRSTNGSVVYPGDREIKLEETVCIQIHKVKLKCDQINKLVGKIIYTLAIYYPEQLASGYISNIESVWGKDQENEDE
jgi:hypothetical protein